MLQIKIKNADFWRVLPAKYPCQVDKRQKEEVPKGDLLGMPGTGSLHFDEESSLSGVEQATFLSAMLAVSVRPSKEVCFRVLPTRFR